MRLQSQQPDRAVRSTDRYFFVPFLQDLIICKMSHGRYPYLTDAWEASEAKSSCLSKKNSANEILLIMNAIFDRINFCLIIESIEVKFKLSKRLKISVIRDVGIIDKCIVVILE